MNWRILRGDVREQLKTLPDGCVQTCVTSPPYFGLRDYGHAGQIGLEPTPVDYVAALVAVFGEVRRVLSDDGTVWVNIGDSYARAQETNVPQTINAETKQASYPRHAKAGSTDGFVARADRPGSLITAMGMKPKDLVGIPWRVAFALQADGWYLRSDIIWSKPNPMPESVTDRPTKAHEYIFLLSKSARYFYDAEAVRETCSDNSHGSPNINPGWKQSAVGNKQGGYLGKWTQEDAVNGRNKRSVWHVATQPYPDAHFATYPEKLIEPCILAGSRIGDTVLDPFCGSGTTGAVAIRHQRNFIGCELNPDYIALAQRRIGAVAPLFAQEHTA